MRPWPVRRVLADLVNASPDEIVFGANMTSLTLRVSRALGGRLGPGDVESLRAIAQGHD